MMEELRFDGRIAIVTGAGGGLGRAHALLLASRGARLVVNDLGTSHTGNGADASAAERVVDEIRAAGGEAVASHDSVVDGDRIVQCALDAFGRVDIIVNNAGFLRDASFYKLTDADWNDLYQVHLLGAFRVTHAAWPFLREQQYGRVINTASASGLYGNFGQSAYAACKLAVHGLTQTLAIEGAAKNIHVNTIAPVADSRMTRTVSGAAALAKLRPELVSPLVAFLAHEATTENGALFEVGGGWIGKLRWERSEGAQLGSHAIEDVAQSWGRIVDFGRSTHPRAIDEALAPFAGQMFSQR
ncbi:MAG: serine/threonine protein kinase [Rhodospirillales bacterium]|nr:serine/threonine protein kinase [Rhodospirillales bacterium]